MSRGFADGNAQAGGAIRNLGDLTLTECTVHLNVSLLGGGGIWNGGRLTVIGSTISSNVVIDGPGGGLENATEATLSMVNSTVSGNQTVASFGGGGVMNGAQAAATLVHCTITGNVGEVCAGLLNSNPIVGSLACTNTLFAENHRSLEADPGIDWVGVLSGGFNLILNPDPGLTGARTNGNRLGPFPGLVPGLQPLANRGGPTETHALAYFHPAIDAGTDAIALTVDQRGLARFQDGDHDGIPLPDIGAAEFRPLLINGPSDTSLNEDLPEGRVAAFTLAYGDVNIGPLSFQTDTTPLRITVAAANTNLLPTPNGLTLLTAMPITNTATTNVAIRIQPAPDRSGSTSVEVEASLGFIDDAIVKFVPVTTNRFIVSVVEVNDPPTLDPIPDVEALEDADATKLVLSGISAGGLEVQSLTPRLETVPPGILSDSTFLYLAPRPSGP